METCRYASGVCHFTQNHRADRLIDIGMWCFMLQKGCNFKPETANMQVGPAEEEGIQALQASLQPHALLCLKKQFWFLFLLRRNKGLNMVFFQIAGSCRTGGVLTFCRIRSLWWGQGVFPVIKVVC